MMKQPRLVGSGIDDSDRIMQRKTLNQEEDEANLIWCIVKCDRWYEMFWRVIVFLGMGVSMVRHAGR
jgi:hypothetical protein